MDIGAIKGVMINGTTRRIRVYGTKHDAGFGFNDPHMTLAVQDAVLKLSLALADAIGSGAQTMLKAQDKEHMMLNDLAGYGEPVNSISFIQGA